MSFSCRSKTDHDNPPNLRKEFCTTGRFNRNSPINLLYPRVDKNEHERTVCVCVFSLSAALGSATAFSSMRKVLQQSKYKWRRSSCCFKHFVFLFPLLSRSYCSDMLYGVPSMYVHVRLFVAWCSHVHIGRSMCVCVKHGAYSCRLIKSFTFFSILPWLFLLNFFCLHHETQDMC